MNSTRKFENENLKERKTSFLWLLLLVAGVIGFQFLNPIIKPHRYSGSVTEWVVTGFMVIGFTGYFIFHKHFVSITFDDLNKKVILITMTLINGKKTNSFSYSDITFNNGKTAGNFRKKTTAFIEMYNGKQMVIKLEKTSIGEYSFEKIVDEFQQLKNLD